MSEDIFISINGGDLMGSSIEYSIVFALIMLLMSFLITGSQEVTVDGFYKTRGGIREIAYMSEEGGVFNSKDIDGVRAVNSSAEDLCTLLSGISDNYRIIYDSVGGL